MVSLFPLFDRPQLIPHVLEIQDTSAPPPPAPTPAYPQQDKIGKINQVHTSNYAVGICIFNDESWGRVG